MSDTTGKGRFVAFCDVCARPANGETVANAEFKRAVGNGFNPFALGLPGEALEQVITMARISGMDPQTMWREQIVERDTTDWNVCLTCMASLRRYLTTGDAVTPPTKTDECSKCGAHNPSNQWHCSACGHIQWGLIAFSLITGVLLAMWAFNLTAVWGQVLAGFGAALFLWIAVSSAREGIRNRERL